MAVNTTTSRAAPIAARVERKTKRMKRNPERPLTRKGTR